MLSCRGLFSGGAAQVLDKDGSGSISTDELREALSGLSSGLEAAEMDEASGRMPRRTHIATIPLPRAYESAEAVEGALLEMIGI